MVNWTWRGRLGQIVAGVWFLLGGLALLGVGAPPQLMQVLAIVAGALLMLGV